MGTDVPLIRPAPPRPSLRDKVEMETWRHEEKLRGCHQPTSTDRISKEHVSGREIKVAWEGQLEIKDRNMYAELQKRRRCEVPAAEGAETWAVEPSGRHRPGGRDPGSRDRVARRAPCMEPASPSARVSASLSLYVYINK